MKPRLVTLPVCLPSPPSLPSALPILDILEKFSVLYHLKFTKEKVIDILSLNNIYREILRKYQECTSNVP